MIIRNKFNIGDFVYCISDPEQERLHITSITVDINNIVWYGCSKLMFIADFSEAELSIEKNILL